LFSGLLGAILASDDHPERKALNRHLLDVGDKRAPGLLNTLVSQGRVDLTDAAMTGVVAQVWAEGEPFRSGVDSDSWIAMFRANGYTEDAETARRPREPVLVFRGAVHERRAGMSWTVDFDVARRFACERMSGRGEGNIYRTSIDPEFLLAYIPHSGLNEEEYVIDQGGLDPSKVELVVHGHDVCR
jgi:hypothetical protein